MRTLLRHIATGRYFQALDKWTLEESLAHNFRRLPTLLRLVEGTGWRGMELVIRLDGKHTAPARNASAQKNKPFLALEEQQWLCAPFAGR